MNVFVSVRENCWKCVPVYHHGKEHFLLAHITRAIVNCQYPNKFAANIVIFFFFHSFLFTALHGQHIFGEAIYTVSNSRSFETFNGSSIHKHPHNHTISSTINIHHTIQKTQTTSSTTHREKKNNTKIHCMLPATLRYDTECRNEPKTIPPSACVPLSDATLYALVCS